MSPFWNGSGVYRLRCSDRSEIYNGLTEPSLLVRIKERESDIDDHLEVGRSFLNVLYLEKIPAASLPNILRYLETVLMDDILHLGNVIRRNRDCYNNNSVTMLPN